MLLSPLLSQPGRITQAVATMANKTVNGYIKEGFEKVGDIFRANLESGLDRGGNFSVYYHNELVVDIWGGFADEEAGRLWKKGDLTASYSITKSVAAIVVAHLVDRKVLDYEEKVCTYWPEFAQNGKGSVTLEQLLSHQAGVVRLDVPFTFAMLRDNPSELCKLLAAQRPLWQLGNGFGYHPYTFGLYIDMIVRKVDRKWRGVADYFREEIALPFGIDFHIGLPKHLQYRATREKILTPFHFMEFLESEEFQGDPDTARDVVMNSPTDFTGMNNPDQREIQSPSTHGHGTAESLAKLYGILANGGVLAEQRLLSSDVIEKFQRPLVAGYCKTYGLDIMFSVGFMNTGVIEGCEPNLLFGHLGFGGQYAMADTEHGVGMAYLTCNNRPDDGMIKSPEIFLSLNDAVYDCILKAENKKGPRKTYYCYSDFLEAGVQSAFRPFGTWRSYATTNTKQGVGVADFTCNNRPEHGITKPPEVTERGCKILEQFHSRTVHKASALHVKKDQSFCQLNSIAVCTVTFRIERKHTGVKIMFDVLIVGAGMMGSAAARHASLNPKLKVGLIGPEEPQSRDIEDARDVFAAHYDEGRISQSLHPDVVWSIMARRSLKRFRELERLSGIKFYDERGTLWVGTNNEKNMDLLQRCATSQGIHCNTDAEMLRQKFNYIDLPPHEKWIFESSNAGTISARGLVRAQQTVARRNGCEIIRDVVNKVTRCPDKAGEYSMRIVTDSGTEYFAKKVLLAPGAFTVSRDLIGPNLKLDVKLTPIIVTLAEIGEQDAEMLQTMPPVLYFGRGRSGWWDNIPSDSQGHSGFYLLPPIRYPDGKFYVKIGTARFYIQSKELQTSADLKAWYCQKGHTDHTTALGRLIQSLLPGVTVKSFHRDSCVIVQTPTSHPYIGMVHSSLGLVTGGNGTAAVSSDELGRLAITMIEDAWEDEKLTTDMFRIQYKNTE
ncbi:hypothetical protein ScPMuIL_004311 [Solemya velum]